MNKTTLLLLSVAASAFIMGGTTLLFLDKRYVRLDRPPGIEASSPGYVRLDDGTQICWGELKVSPLPAGNNRGVEGSFRAPFAEVPRVTLGIHPKFAGGPALTWTAYAPSITPTGYSGNIIGSGADADTMATKEVRVDYVAIGKGR